MKQRRITPRDLAARSGVTRAYIYRILAETQNPSLLVASKLAKAVGLELTLTAK